MNAYRPYSALLSASRWSARAPPFQTLSSVSLLRVKPKRMRAPRGKAWSPCYGGRVNGR